MTPTDPVVARRARILRWVILGKRVGYLLLLLAIVGFAIGVATGFASPAVTLTVAALVGACVVLPVPIVAGYGISAAEREERQARTRHRPPSGPPGER